MSRDTKDCLDSSRLIFPAGWRVGISFYFRKDRTFVKYSEINYLDLLGMKMLSQKFLKFSMTSAVPVCSFGCSKVELLGFSALFWELMATGVKECFWRPHTGSENPPNGGEK